MQFNQISQKKNKLEVDLEERPLELEIRKPSLLEDEIKLEKPREKDLLSMVQEEEIDRNKIKEIDEHNNTYGSPFEREEPSKYNSNSLHGEDPNYHSNSFEDDDRPGYKSSSSSNDRDYIINGM